MARLILIAEINFVGLPVEYFATGTYVTAAGDTPANRLFEARLLDTEMRRGASVALWQNGTPPAAVSSIELINLDGALLSWRLRDVRDQEIVLKTVVPGAAYSTAQVRVRLRGDRLTVGSKTVRIECLDLLSLLRAAMSTAWIAPGTANDGERKRWALGKVARSGADRMGTTADWSFADKPVEQWLGAWAGGLVVVPAVSHKPDVYGFNGSITQGRKVQVQLLGSPYFGTELLGTDGAFNGTAGASPTGWTVTVGAPVLDGSGALIMDSKDTIQKPALDDGSTYVVELRGQAGAGEMSVKGGAVSFLDPFWTIAQTESLWAYFIADGTPFEITCEAGTVALEDARLWPVISSTKIDGAIRAVMARAGIGSALIDSTSLAAVSAAHTGDIGAAGRDETCAEVMEILLRSVSGAMWVGDAGTVEFGSLASISGSSVLDITGGMVQGEPEVTPDLAPGLSTRWLGAVVWDRLGTGEVQSSATAQQQIDATREGETVTLSGVTLHSRYATEAAKRDAVVTAWATSANTLTALQAAAGRYTTPKDFYVLTVLDDAASALLKPFQKVTVHPPVFGLTVATDFLVLAVTANFLGTRRRIELTNLT